MAAEIKIHQSETKVTVHAAKSILNTLLQDGVKIRHDCGGKAQCGTCRIQIKSGSDKLSKKKPLEESRLTAVSAGPDERLACQTYTYGDIYIDIINKEP